LVCLIVSALFFGYILVRAAWSPIDFLWWQDFYMVIACLIVYLLTAFYITSPRERGIVLWGLFALAVVHIFIGLRQFAVGDDWMHFGFIRGTASQGRRASGMFIHSIHLAGYLEAVACFALSLALWSTWKNWVRFLAGYMAILCYVGVAITGSRGGYLSVAFSLFVFAVLSLVAYRKARPRRFLPVLAIGSAVLILVLGGGTALMMKDKMLRDRLLRLAAQTEEKNRDIRFYNWQAAIDQFKLDPVFGTGAGTHLHYGRLFRRPQLQNDPIHAHSDYLELLAEYGIVGGVGMLAFLLSHLGSGWRAYRTVLSHDFREVGDYEPARSNVLALQIGAFSAVAAYLVHSITDFNLHIPGNALLFAFIFGLMANPGMSLPAGKAAATARAFRYALPALAVAMSIFGLPKFPGDYYAEKARVAVRDYDFAAAIRYAMGALESEQRNPNTYFYLGGALRGASMLSQTAEDRRKNLDGAAAAYLSALNIFPQDEHTLVRLGETLRDLGKLKEAEQAFQQAIAMDPKMGVLHAYYAVHLAWVGRQKEAEERLGVAYQFGGPINRAIHGSPLDPRIPRE
jgi:O-antigen ligase